jgi:hypothetical protein
MPRDDAAGVARHAYGRDAAQYDARTARYDTRPWALLAERVPGLSVEEVALGGGYVTWGRLPHGRA